MTSAVYKYIPVDSSYIWLVSFVDPEIKESFDVTHQEVYRLRWTPHVQPRTPVLQILESSGYLLTGVPHVLCIPGTTSDWTFGFPHYARHPPLYHLSQPLQESTDLVFLSMRHAQSNQNCASHLHLYQPIKTV